MAQKTLLFDKHVEIGARMVEFAGWDMPVQYSSIIEEHNTVRNGVGIFDVSHMGEFFVEGKDSLNFLQTLVPQDVSKLYDTKAVYCQLTNKQGGILDDLIIYKINDEKYFIIVNASRIENDFAWISNEAEGYDVEVRNESSNYCLFALQGPKASEMMADMGIPVEEQPEFFSIKSVKLNGIDIELSRTGYTGEDGFEILVKNEFALKIWDYIFEIGNKYDLKPIGLGARDTLRLEAALHLYGNDMNEDTTPIEAGLSWSVSKTKEEDYNGKEVIFEQLKNGGKVKLVGFEMIDKAIARHEYEVYKDGQKIGFVTSGGVAPTIGKNIGLAYVDVKADVKVDTHFQIMVRNKLYEAKVVKRPFVTKRNKV